MTDELRDYDCPYCEGTGSTGYAGFKYPEDAQPLKDRIAELEAKLAEAMKDAEIRQHELMAAREKADRVVQILCRIHALTTPRPIQASDGKTYRFKDPNAADTLNALSDRIRSIPDDLAAIAAQGERK